MSLTDRFRSLDIAEPRHATEERSETRSIRAARKLHRRRRANQEAINRSGVCLPSAMCGCPNCREAESFWQAVRAEKTSGGLTQAEARSVIGRSWTGGAALTPWRDIGGVFGPRSPYDSTPLDESAPEDYFRLTHQPESIDHGYERP